MIFVVLSWLAMAGPTIGTCPSKASNDSPVNTKQRRMEAIKVQILSKLRITEEVQNNITRQSLNFHTRWQVDDYYNEFKVKQQDQVYPVRNDREYYSKAIKLFRFPDERILTANTRHYFFDATLGRYLATGATLKMGISEKNLRRNPRLTSVKIYKLTRPLDDIVGDLSNLDQNLGRYSHAERVKKVKAFHERTFDFDLQTTFSRWEQWPESNFGILICIGKCFRANDDPDMIPFDEVFTGNNEFSRPLLTIDTIDENHVRKKRSGYDCVNPKHQKRCCRYHYYVRFAELGMDWILAPEGYDAYYCSGDCPFMYLSEQKSSLYYTFVIARANYNNPMASPRPCCTPAALSALSIMYSSGQVDAAGQPRHIEIHKLDDMVVDECGCS